MPLSDDSSRGDADKEREHSRRAARRLRTMSGPIEDRNIANATIRRTYQPLPTSLYTRNNTYALNGGTPNKAVGRGLPPLPPAQTKLSWSSDSTEQMAQNRVETAADVIGITPLFPGNPLHFIGPVNSDHALIFAVSQHQK